jgi:hypothetical protein
MNFENVPQKHMSEMELLTRKLLAVMRKAKLQNESLEEALRLFEQELEDARRKRFDTANSEYRTY